MPKITRFADELKNIHSGDAWHGPSLRETLNGVTAEQAIARPVSGAHSIWELVRHITVWENVFRRKLQGDPVNEPEEGDFPIAKYPDQAAWRQALEILDQEHQLLIDTISSLDDAALDDLVPGKPYSISFLIEGLVRHHVYHSGQIAVLKKA